MVYELPHELPNDVGNLEILEKSQIWVETKASAQSLFKKFDFGYSNQNSCKNEYQTFSCPITGFLYFALNILSGIAALK